MTEKKKLGEILLQAGAITAQQLKDALEDQQKYGGRLGNILLDRRYISEKTYLSALSQQLKIPAVDFSKSTIPEVVIRLVPMELQEKYLAFPVATRRTARGNILVLAMQDPTNVEIMDEIGFRIGYRIEPVIALESVLREIIQDYWYQQEGKGSYHYKPDLEIGGFEGQTTGAPRVERFIPNERMIDFNGSSQARSEDRSGEETKPQLTPNLEKGKPSRELLALLRLLVKKKIITEQEFLEELKKTK